MKRTTCALLVAGTLLLLAGISSAQATDVAVHGFLSQGYLNSSENNYAGAPTDEGTFAFNEAGLNFTSQPLPGLRVAAQVFARDLGSQGNHRVTLDWAVGDYSYRDWLGVRVGRIKLPFGLYNTLRDVDMARAEILQPASIYPLSQRDLVAAFNGASAYGRLRLGAVGGLEYEAFGGTQDLDEVYAVRRFVADGSQAALPALAAIGMTNTTYTVNHVQANMEHLYGLRLLWNSPVAGLRAGVSFESTRSHITSDVTYSGSLGSAPVPVSIPTHAETQFENPSMCIASLEYQRGGLKLASEYYRDQVDRKTSATGMPGPPVNTGDLLHGEAWYLQGSYRLNTHFQGQAYYSVYWPDRNDKDGSRYARQSQEYRAWAKDLALTARADVNAHWLLKLEYHFFDGAATLSTAENPGAVTRKWGLFVVNTTLYF
jgi:hypothetical protein